MDFQTLLPLIFLGLMGFSMLMYAVLDGYDLGVGILAGQATPEERDMMLASIGPFWDANETWLVLGIGLLLVAFPTAHGLVLSGLYIPVALMLLGLIMRGVAFDFRAKAHGDYKETWDLVFRFGSSLTAFIQGYMLGKYVVGLEDTFLTTVFAIISGFCVSAAYVHIGACWLILKTTGTLQQKSIAWAKRSLVIMFFGIILVSIINPLVSERIYERWFDWPNVLWVLPVPILAFGAMIYSAITLNRMKRGKLRSEALPFILAMVNTVMSFIGLGYSFFPFVVPDRLTVWEAAASYEALVVIFWGAIVVVPLIALYTAFSYYVFRGKAEDLSYD